MYEFGEKHPIGFEIILIIVSFLAAGAIVMVCDLQKGVYRAKCSHKSRDRDSVALVCSMECFLQPQFGDGLRRKRVLH